MGASAYLREINAGIAVSTLLAALAAAFNPPGYRDFPDPAAAPVSVPLQVAEPMLAALGLAAVFAACRNTGDDRR